MRRIIITALGVVIGLGLGIFAVKNQENDIEVQYAERVVFLDNSTVEKVESEVIPIGSEIEAYDCVEANERVCIGTYKITAYCACEKCCGKWAELRGCENVYGSIGQILTAGKSIAVDPDVIPYGTKVYIQGNEYTAQDCGVVGNTIDIYMNSHEEALEWGVQYIDVYADSIDLEEK